MKDWLENEIDKCDKALERKWTVSVHVRRKTLRETLDRLRPPKLRR